MLKRRSELPPVVLVPKDEPIQRMMIVDLVEKAGFEALEVAGVNEAVRILEERLDIHIVFADIDMPGGVDGLKLAANSFHPQHLIFRVVFSLLTAAGSPPALWRGEAPCRETLVAMMVVGELRDHSMPLAELAYFPRGLLTADIHACHRLIQGRRGRQRPGGVLI